MFLVVFKPVLQSGKKGEKSWASLQKAGCSPHYIPLGRHVLPGSIPTGPGADLRPRMDVSQGETCSLVQLTEAVQEP